MLISKVYSKSIYLKARIKQALYFIHLKLLYNDKLKIIGKGEIHRTVEFDISPFNSKIRIGDNFNLRKNCIFRTTRNAEIKIGTNVFFNSNCSLNSMGRIEIGDYCNFGENVLIYDHNHNYKTKGIPICEQGYSVSAVKIGNNCWIGSGCVILKGVTIGDNSVIGANNLIYKSIQANTLILNNQAKTSKPL